MNISKTADVKQLADSLLSKMQKKLLQHLQEACNIDITDSQHLPPEEEPDIVQEQDTEPTKQPRRRKPKVNLSPTRQSTQTGRDEHSECFADECLERTRNEVSERFTTAPERFKVWRELPCKF